MPQNRCESLKHCIRPMRCYQRRPILKRGKSPQRYFCTCSRPKIYLISTLCYYQCRGIYCHFVVPVRCDIRVAGRSSSFSLLSSHPAAQPEHCIAAFCDRTDMIFHSMRFFQSMFCVYCHLMCVMICRCLVSEWFSPSCRREKVMSLSRVAQRADTLF